MGTAERNYSENSRRGPGMFASLTPVVKGLLILNVVIYLLDITWNKQVRQFGAFTIDSAIFHGHVWEFVTFQFLHGHVAHLIFNSIGLFFFGPWMERWWGAKRFAIFYLVSGVGGAAFFSLLTFVGVLPSAVFTPLVGASAGIYGILAGIAVVAPDMRVALLFPPIELSMRQMALALLAIATGSILLKIGGNEGGEAGHLGGALVGFLLVRFPWLIPRGGRREGIEVIRPKAFSRKSEAKLRPRSRIDLTQDSEIDRILDKISSDGFQSLTEEERAKLQRAANPNTHE